MSTYLTSLSVIVSLLLPMVAGAQNNNSGQNGQPADLQQFPPDTKEWQQMFGDATLDTLISLATSNNYDLLNAIRKIEMSRAQLRIQQSGFYPTVDLTGSYTLEKTSMGIEHVDQRDNIGEAAVGMSWEADIFGSIRKGAKAQRNYYLASREEYRGVRVSLISEVAAAYISLRKYQAMLDIARRNLASQEEIMNLTATRYKTGLTSQLDAAQARSLYLQTKASLPAIETGIIQGINNLTTLTGQWNDSLRRQLSQVAPLPRSNGSVITGIPAELVRNRPDIAAAERTMEALTAKAGATKADWWPKFFVNGSFGYGSPKFSHFTDRDNMTWQVVPSVKWTIFSGRQIVQTTRMAMLQLDEGINTFNNTMLSAMGEIDNALYAYNRSLLQLSAQREAYEQIGITFKLAEELYKKGLSSYENLQDSQKSLLSYENALIAAESNTLLYLIQLYKALGGTARLIR